MSVHDVRCFDHRAAVAGRPPVVFRPNHRMVLRGFIGPLVLVCLVGCQATEGLRDTLAYNDGFNDVIVGWRNRVWASQAWHEQRDLAANQSFPADFEQGFRDGYAATGYDGDGCPPPVPPRKYWTWKYQSPEGQGKVSAWYAGWPHGARAAEEDGVTNWSQIQVSHLIEKQYAPPYTGSAGNPGGAPSDPIAPPEPQPASPVPPAPPADGAGLQRVPQPPRGQVFVRPLPPALPSIAAR